MPFVKCPECGKLNSVKLKNCPKCEASLESVRTPNNYDHSSMAYAGMPQQPAAQPQPNPWGQPAAQPAAQPQPNPWGQPAAQPAAQPQPNPWGQPAAQPAAQPQPNPWGQPAAQPAAQPQPNPWGQPAAQPAAQPQPNPWGQPAAPPTAQPQSTPWGHLRSLVGERAHAPRPPPCSNGTRRPAPATRRATYSTSAVPGMWQSHCSRRAILRRLRRSNPALHTYSQEPILHMISDSDNTLNNN